MRRDFRNKIVELIGSCDSENYMLLYRNCHDLLTFKEMLEDDDCQSSIVNVFDYIHDCLLFFVNLANMASIEYSSKGNLSPFLRPILKTGNVVKCNLDADYIERREMDQVSYGIQGGYSLDVDTVTSTYWNGAFKNIVFLEEGISIDDRLFDICGDCCNRVLEYLDGCNNGELDEYKDMLFRYDENGKKLLEKYGVTFKDFMVITFSLYKRFFSLGGLQKSIVKAFLHKGDVTISDVIVNDRVESFRICRDMEPWILRLEDGTSEKCWKRNGIGIDVTAYGRVWIPGNKDILGGRRVTTGRKIYRDKGYKEKFIVSITSDEELRDFLSLPKEIDKMMDLEYAIKVWVRHTSIKR